jgi:membrane-bound lytic murein transglycosylase B
MSWRVIVPAVLGTLLGAAVIAALIVLLGGDVDRPRPSTSAPAAPRWAPPADPPVAAAEPGSGVAGRADALWAARAAEETEIPERAVLAYAGAALMKAAAMPECGLSWATLAAIGGAESDHGRHGGASIAPDGTVSPPILGVALDGGDTAEIPDSDGGEIDGDPEFDRAVGPMQLIPETWRNWHIDGSGDGVEDPHNIDDAALAAANYLCRASTALDTEPGWRAAVAAYNSAPSYLERVATLGVRYAEATAR